MCRWLRAAALVAAGSVMAGGAADAVAAAPGATLLTGGVDLAPGEIPAGESGAVDRTGGAGRARPSLSADGRYVAFLSGIDALAPAAERDAANVFRKDRVTGRVTLVNRATGAAGAPAAGASWNPVISDDGRRIAWATAAALDPTDVDGLLDVYVRDLAARTTTLATPGTAAAVQQQFDLSGDGRHVAFATAEPLLPGDVNRALDVFRRDLTAGTTELVSLDAAGGNADNESRSPSISSDGRWVAFSSPATDLVSGLSHGFARSPSPQIYARDMTATTNATTLVSNSYGLPSQTSLGENRNPRIAVDAGGTVHVGFESRSEDLHQRLVSPITNQFFRGFARDMTQTGAVLLASGSTILGRPDTTVDGISGDGRVVVFTTTISGLGGPTDNFRNIYARDVVSGTLVTVSGGSGGGNQETDGAISDDGSVVSWRTQAPIVSDLDHGFAGIYARTLPAGPVELVSRPRRAGALRAPALVTRGNESAARTISADGRYVVLEVESRTATTRSVYRRDTWTGALEPAARLTGPGGAITSETSEDASISADGSRVAFATAAQLDPDDGDRLASIYVRDFAADTTTLASRADGVAGANAGDVRLGLLSGDGRHVAFVGWTGSTNGLYVRDLAADTTTLASRATGVAGTPATRVTDVAISDDGTVAAFDTTSQLDSDDASSGDQDVYVRDLTTDTTRLATRQSGASGAKGSGRSPVLSGDGHLVVFISGDETIAPEAGGWSGIEQAVARDLTTDQTTLVSRVPGGAPANAHVTEISADGSGAQLTFQSRATNLLSGQGGRERSAVFVRASDDGSLSAPPPFGPADDGYFSGGALTPSLSANGRCLAFVATGHAPGQRRGVGDISTSYVYALPATTPRAPRCRTRR